MDQPSDTPRNDHRTTNPAERHFETFLWSSRLLILFTVIPSILGALVLFVIGTMDIFKVVMDAVAYYTTDTSTDIHDTVVPDIILAIDIYLIGVVLLVFGAGIYRLFISPIDQAESIAPRHPFHVHSFDHLKDKIARVVVLAVIIEFFRAVVDIRFQTPLDAIYLAVSVLALTAGLFLLSHAHRGSDKE